MNCEKAEQLIPLFVEEDLDAAEMQQVRQHLETCQACHDLATEFQASQSLLHATASPEFGEAVFDEMRTAVQHAVARAATRPALLELLNPIWTWKVAFAAAAALLLVASGLVVYEKGKRTSSLVARTPQQQIEQNETASGSEVIADKGAKLGGVRYRERERPGPQVRAHSKPQVAHAPRTAPSLKSLTIPEKSVNYEARPNQVAIVQPQITTPIVWPFSAEGLNTIPPFANDSQALEDAKKTDEPEMLRMEIQTADPNIKIIWLTPKEPASARNHTDADTR